MRATISTAPTPFESCTKEELHDWLSDPVTEKLIASLRQHIKETEASIVNPRLAALEDCELAHSVRRLIDQREDRITLLDWIQGANRA